ncbi:lysM and putative peptidoglycan-binding domain-containing protein 2 isoform X2 [Rattus norvegicus]
MGGRGGCTVARSGFSRTLSRLHGSEVHMGSRTPPWASVGPQASARSRRAFSGRTRTLQPRLSSLIAISTGTSGAWEKLAQSGARHAGPAAPRLGLAPAAPAARPAAALVRRKRRRRRRRPLGELGAPAALAGPMADLSPAPALREGGPRAHRPSAPSPPLRSRSTSEPEEAELSLSLARTKTRSYGSTASVRAPLGAGVIERHVEHRVRAGDTLQGIALKYGVTG